MEIAEGTADHQRLFDPIRDAPFVPARTVLIDVDVSNGQVYRIVERVRVGGLPDVADYFNAQVAEILPRIRSLKDACRRAAIDVMHLTCASYTGDGRDCSADLKAAGVKATAGEEDAEIVMEVAPRGGEIVLSKVAASAFNGSDLDFLLRRLGKDTLIITGLVTATCVEGTVRGAADRGFKVFLIDDACACWTEGQHSASIRILGQWFATVVDSAEMLRRLRASASSERSARITGQSSSRKRIQK